MADLYEPINLTVRQALLDRLAARLPDLCAAAGFDAPTLETTAGKRIADDTYYLDWTGRKILGRASTWTDVAFHFDLELWTQHVDAVTLQEKALVMEWAIRAAYETDRQLLADDDLYKDTKVVCGDGEGSRTPGGEGNPIVHAQIIPIVVYLRIKGTDLPSEEGDG